jgi:hypothetical protein
MRIDKEVVMNAALLMEIASARCRFPPRTPRGDKLSTKLTLVIGDPVAMVLARHRALD